MDITTRRTYTLTLSEEELRLIAWRLDRIDEEGTEEPAARSQIRRMSKILNAVLGPDQPDGNTA